jgi:superfamily II DNA/RNA helicase
VITPTRELCAQVEDSVRTYGKYMALKSITVYGGVGINPQIDALRRGVDILVATPGRLLDHVQQRTVDLRQVEILVLDEADRMLDMGFRPAVERIVVETPSKRQTIFFSATLDGAIGRLAAKFTKNPVRRTYEPPKEASGVIEHRFVGVSSDRKVDVVAGEIRADAGGRTLVFVRTKRGADRLAKKLAGRGIDVAAMHGNKSQAQRSKALSRFDAGRIEALIATDVAARGIDVKGINRVINFDPPGDHTDYVHRVGRTGRAGADGEGITLVLDDQAREMARIDRKLGLGAAWEGGMPPREGRRSRTRY